MGLWLSIPLTLFALLVIAIIAEMLLRRGRPRPSLAQQFLGDAASDEAAPDQELGLEAVDMEVIRASERANTAAASLGARDLQFWTQRLTRRPAPQDKPIKETK
ncbi:MAG: hypothetical protein CSA68_05320 [Rhodobacterales bacterium]|nr:MAG: hypothetical protein CSA68_05320 [Rhodobacterales bacterium]